MIKKPNAMFSMGIDQIDLRLLALRTPTAMAVERMAASLIKRGQLTPIIIADDGQHPMLIDGFKRHQAAQSLGLDSLKATCLSADATQAKVMMYLLNRAGTFSMIQEAILVRELVDSDGLTQNEAAKLLDHHKSWVSRRLLMIRHLAPPIIEDLKLALLPPGSAPALARLPSCNQSDFAAAIQMHCLSVKQIRDLIDLWFKAAAPQTKQFLLKSPIEALNIIEEENKNMASLQKTLQKIGKLISVFENQLQTRSQELSREAICTLTKFIQPLKVDLLAVQQYVSKENL
jgi:ParB-like chromosome segregation protein Spo0J